MNFGFNSQRKWFFSFETRSVVASYSLIRQKIERLSSSGFAPTDFSEFEDIEEPEEEGANAVEKGGLFLAGNIAGAKGQQVGWRFFDQTRSKELRKVSAPEYTRRTDKQFI